MYDPTATYRSAQVTSSSPAGQVVLLYEGAIRFGTRHLAALEHGDIQAAHDASLRCQSIVAALREVLDKSAGDIALRLDGLYDFCLRRLVDGNIHKDPEPTAEALTILRELLEAWRAIAGPSQVSVAVGPVTTAAAVAPPEFRRAAFAPARPVAASVR